MRYWDSTRAFEGYTLFGSRGVTYLLDMEDREVYTCPIGANPHVYDNEGIYTVTLTATLPSGDSTEIKENLVLVSESLPAGQAAFLCILVLTMTLSGAFLLGGRITFGKRR